MMELAHETAAPSCAPDPSPFLFRGGPVGCLLIHGFTGAPSEVRPLGEFLAQRGLTVLGPRLPGHGTQVADMFGPSWQDWYAEVVRGLEQLRRHCRAIFVGGLSLGGTLALHLGAQREVAGLIPMSAALEVSTPLLHLVPIAKYLVRSIPKAWLRWEECADPAGRALLFGYADWPVAPAHELLKVMRRVRRELTGITAPVLVVQGRRDTHVPPASAERLLQRLGSTDKQILWLPGSGHCVTVDRERELLWQRVHEFIARRSYLDLSTGQAAASQPAGHEEAQE